MQNGQLKAVVRHKRDLTEYNANLESDINTIYSDSDDFDRLIVEF